ncbi:MAG: tRNA lysidine(34) synthetase TilS [Symbiobacteriaceae bacterium]|nr:tRNA lysidine(34) synthetase TilS [Symbiobacteriaceae bacterium]
MLDTAIFCQHVKSAELLGEDEHILIAFSAGPDSLALLFLFLLCQKEMRTGWQLSIAHLDHSLQPDSVLEAEYVRQIASRFGLPCYQAVEDVSAIADSRKLGIEEAGRAARYRFLTETAVRIQATVVAFGHQGDDLLEHFWLRLLRGASPGSLAGIPVSRPLAPGIRILRPLLPFSRKEIVDYLSFCRQNYPEFGDLLPFEDPDNQLIRFQRNRVRHQLMPFLDTWHPNWRRALQGMMQTQAEDENYLRQECLKLLANGHWRLGLYSYPWQEWLLLHPALRKRLLLYIFNSMGNASFREPIQRKHLRDLEEKWAGLQPGKELALPGGCSLRRSDDELFFLLYWPPPPWGIDLNPVWGEKEILLPWALAGHPVFFKSSVISSISSVSSIPSIRDAVFTELTTEPVPPAVREEIESNGTDQFIALQWLDHNWTLRSWLPGDRIEIRAHLHTLGEVMRAAGIPPPARYCYPVVEIDGEIAALAGLVVADRYRSSVGSGEAIYLDLHW